MKKILTQVQLSLCFKIALLINTVGLLFDLIIYHYFDNSEIMKSLAENLSNVSLFIISVIIISQTRSIVIQHYKSFVTHYKITALSIQIFLGVLSLWVLKIDNDIQEKVIIFASSLSKFDHSYRLFVMLFAIFMFLVLDFYKTIITLSDTDTLSAPQVLRSTLWLVLKKHFLISICLFRFAHFKKIHILGIALFHYSQTCLLYDLKILVIIMPLTWLGAFAYFTYQRYANKNNSK